MLFLGKIAKYRGWNCHLAALECEMAKIKVRNCHLCNTEGNVEPGGNGQKGNVEPGGNGQKRNMKHFVQCLLNLQKDTNAL